MASNSSSELDDLIRRMSLHVKPHMRPKTKLGQSTIGVNRSTTQFQGLKKEYYDDPSKLQPFINYLKGQNGQNNLTSRILEDTELSSAPEGIYTWILKRGHLYAMGLMTNQEIGSLHADIDLLTLHQENVGFINHNTLKNNRFPEAKPFAAGEVLVSRETDAGVVLYFNLQSGTFSAKLLLQRARELGEQRGMACSVKEIKELKRECLPEMVKDVAKKMSDSTQVPLENVRFLSCSNAIQKELEDLQLLKQGYTHGPCRDDNGYMEGVAGRNLIRRFTTTTSMKNLELFKTYFNNEPPVLQNTSVLGKRKATQRNQNNQKNQTGSNNPPKRGGRKKTRKQNKRK